MGFDIICFGSAVVDVFVDTDVNEKGKYMCYPVGSKILLKNLRFDIGGGGTNTAVAFSRLGLRTGWVGKIGNDSDGKTILDEMKKERVRFLGVVEKDRVSGYSIILDSRQNNRTVLTYKGINDELKLGEIKLRKFKTRWMFMTSMLRESFLTQRKVASLLKKKGVKIAYNPSEYLIKRENLCPLLKIVDVLIFNKEEAELLLRKNKIKEKDLLRGVHSLIDRKGIVVITDKNKSIMTYDGVREYSLRPHKIRVIERTGAGDAFASGFVAGQVAGWDIDKSLKLGLEESESVIRYFGAKNNLIRRKIK
jgi:ribokinase